MSSLCYHVSVVPSPRSWEETVMGRVKTLSGSVVYEGTVQEAHAWIQRKGLKYLPGTDGLWVESSKSIWGKIARFLNLVNEQ